MPVYPLSLAPTLYNNASLEKPTCVLPGKLIILFPSVCESNKMAANYTERPHDEFVVAPEGGNVESELDQKKHDKVNIDQVGVNGEPGMLGEVPFGEVDQAYLSSSKFTRFYRGLFFQMVLFSA